MKNATLRNETGRKLEFFEDCRMSKDDLKAYCLEKYGPGVYVLSWRIYKSNGEGKKKGSPRNLRLHAGSGEYPQAPRGALLGIPAAASNPETLAQIVRLQMTQENLLARLDEIDERICELEENGEAFGGTPDDDGEEPEEEKEPLEKLLGLAQNPKYSGLITAVMSAGGDTELMAERIKGQITENPALLKDIITDALGAFNTSGAA